jgi:hypothetical protein
MWFGQRNTEGEAELESDIPEIAATLDPEGETCLSIDESTSPLNTAVSMNDNTSDLLGNEYTCVTTAAFPLHFVLLLGMKIVFHFFSTISDQNTLHSHKYLATYTSITL